MFDDTDCPVCLAIFDKEESDDFYVYQLDNFIGKYNKNLIWYRVIDHGIYKWKFNDPQGEIGIWAIDNTTSNTIKFLLGNKIDASNVKSTSRSNTRVSPIGFKVKNLDLFCEKCNDCLEWYRSCTNDIFMTSFKGLRSDGKYRRRLDFKTVRCILNQALRKLNES